MAEEAFGASGLVDYWEIGDAHLEAFARLVAEDCAKVCADRSTGSGDEDYAAEACARAIRAKYALTPGAE